MRRAAVLILALLLFAAPALGEGLPLVVDGAGLLTAEQLDALTRSAEELSGRYGMDVVILTVPSIGERAALEYAADWYDANGYGRGAQRDGVVLMLSMERRDWCILTTGRGIDALTDYTIDRIAEDILPYFSDGSYAEGFDEFLFDAKVALSKAEMGEPYDVDNPVSFAGTTSSAEVRTTLGPGLPFIAFNILMGYWLLHQTGGI